MKPSTLILLAIGAVLTIYGYAESGPVDCVAGLAILGIVGFDIADEFKPPVEDDYSIEEGQEDGE